MSDTAPARDTAPERRDTTEATSTTAPSGQHTETTATAPAKTSVAAVFALVFGLMAFLAALTGLLAPIAVVFGLIGVVLGILGVRAAKKPLTTGKGVAIGGLVLSILAVLLGGAALIGIAAAVSSNPQILDQISNLVSGARSQLPTG